jgi:Asp-tRNAAsn/Glu-tRNAGln amidotransferase A subunit and related amidases
MELTSLSAVELARAVRSREVTAVEVTAAHLERAERVSGSVGAFARITPELAMRTAERVDARLAAGEEVGPLAGVPCPIKDLNAVAGVGMEAGCAALSGYVPDRSDDIVGWLDQAGTVCTGKTATPEFGLPCYTEPETGSPARTPWDLDRMAGGSSGGAAAAVAAGLAPIAQASDGGGSIRIPASCCGLVGLKPSRGRISPGRGRPPGPGLSTDGVLSRTVTDTALALDVLAGPRPGDTYGAPSPVDGFLAAAGREPDRLRIGVLTTPVIAEAEVHPACGEAAAHTAAQLAELGHDVVEAPVPFPVERWAAFQALWAVGAAGIPVPATAEPLLRPLTRWLRSLGREASGLDYAAAVSAVQQLTVEVAEAWDGFDAVLMPTLAQPPLPIGALRDDDDPAADFAAQTRFTPWTSVFNLSGRPAISLPLHTAVVDGSRLPIGVMFGGRFGEEALLLSLAGQLETTYGWTHPFVAAEF